MRAFRLADDHLGRVGRKSRAAIDIALRAARLWTRFFARLNLAEFVGLGAVLTVGFLLVRNGDVSVGTATAAALYFHGLFNPINVALALVDDAQAAMASLARLVGVAETRRPRNRTSRHGRRTRRSRSPVSGTPTVPARRSCTVSTSTSGRGSGWRWSGRAARARPRSPS